MHDTHAVTVVSPSAMKRCAYGIPPGMSTKTPEGGRLMKTLKAFLTAASCGLVLWGAVAVRAMGPEDDEASGGPICLESAEVRVYTPCPPPE